LRTDPKSGEWVEDADFAAYTLLGEIGAESISKAKADEIIARAAG